MPIEDVDGDDAGGGAIGDIHFGGVGADDGESGSRTEEHRVAHFVSPGVNGLQAVGLGRDDVEFAAVGFEKHLRGLSREFEISEENGAIEIDDGETRLRAAHDEGESGIGSDEDFVGLRNYGNGVQELESARVMDGEHASAAIDHGDVLTVGREVGLNGFGGSVSAAEDLSGGGVNGDDLIGCGGGGVDAIAIGRKIQRIR